MKVLDPKQIKNCVYIVEDSGLYKIGRASNFKSRLVSLQCGNPRKLNVIATLSCSDPKREEKVIHDLLKDYRHIREWFDIPNVLLDSLKEDFVKNNN